MSRKEFLVSRHGAVYDLLKGNNGRLVETFSSFVQISHQGGFNQTEYLAFYVIGLGDVTINYKKIKMIFVIPEKTTIFICPCFDFDTFAWTTKYPPKE